MKKVWSKLRKKISRLQIIFFLALFTLLVAIMFGVFFAVDSRKGDDLVTAKSAALHLYSEGHSSDSTTTPGEATSGYVIPRDIIDNDFTIRISLKVGDHNYKGEFSNILSIQGDGTNSCAYATKNNRISFNQDASPISHLNFYSRPCKAPEGEVPLVFFGERNRPRAMATYEDYFLVYKRPVAGVSDGYYRIYNSFQKNLSIIPQGMDMVKRIIEGVSTANNPNGYRISCLEYDAAGKCIREGSLDKYLNYVIDKNTNTDWQGNDNMFKIVVGDKNHPKQDIKITELTMWTRALDTDMGIDPVDPLYYAPYYSASGTYDKYQSKIINGITHKPFDSASSLYKNDAYFHFGSIDEGVIDNTWRNNISGAPSGIDLKFRGMASLTSDVPSWLESNYPVASTAKPILSGDDYSVSKISNSEIEISGIPIATAQDNASVVPIKSAIYISTGTNYIITQVKRLARIDPQSPVIISDLDLLNKHYYVTVEWTDGLENTKFITKRVISEVQETSSSSDTSIQFNDVVTRTDIENGYIITHNNKIANPANAYRLPVNQPFTFRVVFKLNSIPKDSKPVSLFGVYDRLHDNDGYKAINIAANNVGGKLYANLSLVDGDKYYYPKLNNANNKIALGQWEEFWFSYKHPTSSAQGELYVYRYDRATKSLIDIYNNDVPQPIVWSWFSDWFFKKWETRIYFGCTDNINSTTDFNISGASWWNKSLSQLEIGGLAGKDIAKLSRDERREDLMWNSGTDISGSTIESKIGSLSEAFDLNLTCKSLITEYHYQKVVEDDGAITYKHIKTLTSVNTINCLTSADVPAFLNDDTTAPVISLASSYTDYVGYPIVIEPIASYADDYTWSVTNNNNVTDPITFNPTDGRSKNTTITASTYTGKDQNYQIKLRALNTVSTKFNEKTTNIYIHKLADINGDNSINFTDFSFLLSNWGTSTNSLANIVRTGTSATNVDFQDFSVLLSKWGS